MTTTTMGTRRTGKRTPVMMVLLALLMDLRRRSGVATRKNSIMTITVPQSDPQDVPGTEKVPKTTKKLVLDADEEDDDDDEGDEENGKEDAGDDGAACPADGTKKKKKKKKKPKRQPSVHLRASVVPLLLRGRPLSRRQ